KPVHRPLENGHCVASLPYGHCLHINIELQPRALLVDEVTTFAEIVEKVDDLVSGQGVGHALYIDMLALLAADLVLDMCVGLIGDQDLPGRSHLFEPAREIHTTTDDGVVHPVFTAEVPNGAEACVNSSSTPWRFFYARSSPDTI